MENRSGGDAASTVRRNAVPGLAHVVCAPMVEATVLVAFGGAAPMEKRSGEDAASTVRPNAVPVRANAVCAPFVEATSSSLSVAPRPMEKGSGEEAASTVRPNAVPVLANAVCAPFVEPTSSSLSVAPRLWRTEAAGTPRLRKQVPPCRAPEQMRRRNTNRATAFLRPPITRPIRRYNNWLPPPSGVYLLSVAGWIDPSDDSAGSASAAGQARRTCNALH